MNDRLQPAFWGGLFIGVLSALPIVNVGNCCCCLWVICGGALAAYLRQQNSPVQIEAAEGALVGLMAGAIGGGHRHGAVDPIPDARRTLPASGDGTDPLEQSRCPARGARCRSSGFAGGAALRRRRHDRQRGDRRDLRHARRPARRGDLQEEDTAARHDGSAAAGVITNSQKIHRAEALGSGRSSHLGERFRCLTWTQSPNQAPIAPCLRSTPCSRSTAASRRHRSSARQRSSPIRPSTTRAAQDPEAFWAGFAGELEWIAPWTKVLDWKPPHAKWFVGGKLNVSANCLDRHVRTARRNKAALIWEGEPGDRRTLTYWDLYREVGTVRQRPQVARRQARRSRRDLPAAHSRARHRDARLRAHRRRPQRRLRRLQRRVAARSHQRRRRRSLLVTADGGYRRGQIVPLKQMADEALRDTPSIKQRRRRAAPGRRRRFRSTCRRAAITGTTS